MRKLIVGNWKMNGSLASLPHIAEIGRAASAWADVEVGLAVPATLIAPAAQLHSGLIIGAQDIHGQSAGAFTGSLSAGMVQEVGATLAIVGHSERRQMQGESSADVQGKAAAGIAAGLQIILCVGESMAVRAAGGAEDIVSQQLADSMPVSFQSGNIAIAYEPIWAIGTGKVATVAEIAAMHSALRARLRTLIGDKANAVRLLYGGSVTAANAPSVLGTENVNGALVGGASLTSADFTPVIAAAAAA